VRVCLVTSSFLPGVGGAEVVVHNLATALVRLGHAVTVLAPRSSRPYRRIVPYTLETFLPGTLPLLNRDGWWGEAYLLGTLAWLRGRFDVVNLHFALPLGPALVRHRRFVGTPILLTFHGTDIQTEPSLGYGLRLDPRLNDKIREATNGVDGLVANSPSVRQAILEVLEAPKPVFDIPNGVWVDRFRGGRPRGLFRARIGVPADAPLVLAVGRHHPKKGFVYLVEAMRAVADEEPEVRCAIVGRGVRDLKDQVDRLGLSRVVHLVEEIGPEVDGKGPLVFPPESLVDAYRDCDVFVSPSLMEGCSLVVLEALAAGCAVVATDAPGNRDAVQDGVNGLVCRPRDPQDLARKILAVVRDAGLRDRLGAAARRRALAYDWLEVARRYGEAYERLRIRLNGGV